MSATDVHTLDQLSAYITQQENDHAVTYPESVTETYASEQEMYAARLAEIRRISETKLVDFKDANGTY